MENLVVPMDFSSFFHNKKVFITGHTGFKGSWLTCVLQKFGANVYGYALPPEQPGGLYDYLAPELKDRSFLHDIRDREYLQKVVADIQPDIVFHLAAQPLVRRSYELPAETFDINVTGTANLLQAIKSVNNKCAVVVITTDKVYQNREQDVYYKEMDALGGYDPYSTSKACCELVCDSFRSSFFNPSVYNQHQKSIATARAGNVIGGGDWSRDRLLPDIVNSLLGGNTLQIRYPDSVRPWQHVLEAIAGYLLLAQKLYNHPLEYSRPYNFGPLPGDHLKVREVVQYAIEQIGKGDWQDISASGQPHEAGLLKLDIARAKSELNWNPKLNARQAIEWTLKWYQQPDESRLAFTHQQVDQYFSL